MGCSFCVLASLRNLETSAVAPGNRKAFELVTNLEVTSHYSFQPGRWLCDVAPNLLTHHQALALQRAKQKATRRRELEACLPQGLRFERGWPPQIPTDAEAQTIALTRAELLEAHELPNHYPTATDIIERFAELHDAR